MGKFDSLNKDGKIEVPKLLPTLEQDYYCYAKDGAVIDRGIYITMLDVFPSEIILKGNKITALLHNNKYKQSFSSKAKKIGLLSKVSYSSKNMYSDDFDLEVGLLIALIKSLHHGSNVSKNSLSELLKAEYADESEYKAVLRALCINLIMTRVGATVKNGISYKQANSIINNILQAFEYMNNTKYTINLYGINVLLESK